MFEMLTGGASKEGYRLKTEVIEKDSLIESCLRDN